eukprot:TRINITY_DN1293_c0_g1_i3.p1 TRINITY_DN1293_c0_g1~~TRINITY_DN1293_c0_g1_i3.p1  ORF type:complete len:116 (-),score=33.63 TRINITY_DN1293_c0_g1_i3:94-441(-)
MCIRDRVSTQSTGVFFANMASVMSDKELALLKEQLNKMPNDKDRIKLVKRTKDNFHFSCKQVRELIEVQHYGEAAVQTAILLYPKIVDNSQYVEEVINHLKFPDDKAEVRKALGL